MMASSYNKKHAHKKPGGLQNLISFSKPFAALSIILTLILIVLSYRDVIYLRFASDFIGGTTEYSIEVKQLLIDGFSNQLINTFSAILPYVMITVATTLVIYWALITYKSAYLSLDVNENYVNTKRYHPLSIILKNILVRSSAFIIPAFFWSFYLMIWFPAIVEYPLRFITNTNITPLVISTLIIILVLSMMTHFGVIISRLSVELSKSI